MVVCLLILPGILCLALLSSFALLLCLSYVLANIVELASRPACTRSEHSSVYVL